jgi:hypothetical protein
VSSGNTEECTDAGGTFSYGEACGRGAPDAESSTWPVYAI